MDSPVERRVRARIRPALDVLDSEGAEVTASVTRLADDLYLITSDARAGPARRQIARVVRLDRLIRRCGGARREWSGEFEQQPRDRRSGPRPGAMGLSGP